ncbi:glycosyltransferase [Sphingomonas sp. F9_3S_D5_B_2]
MFTEALALIEVHDFGEAGDDSRLLEKAEFLYDARDHDRARELFEKLLVIQPESDAVRFAYAKRLLPTGELTRARNLLLPMDGKYPEENWRHGVIRRALGKYDLLSRLEGSPIPEGVDARIIAMKHAILYFRNRKLPASSGSALGRLTLITGSLGPGGAERQLTRLAIELERARKSTGSIAGVRLNRPVEILVRSHGPEKQNDFYLDDVQAAGCELGQINQFKPLSNRTLGIDEPVLVELLDYLPSPVNYGVRRLTRHFEESGTDTASIWQDGACLFAGFAALMAGVPHVQLAIRGLPPSMRRHMYRPEYEVLYRAMAQVPGVRFVSNSISAARAYAEWLHLPLDRFDIVYNGVEPMKPEPSHDCARRWDEFVASTPDADQTIGGVFRFDTDKQPLLWIRFAARYLKRHPTARFVLVGGGRLQPNAEELAAELGIAHRILFVGRSTRVGYWMSKMDTLVLLSRFEGLPNVLIEAQYMGVRVVTTPAGGAAECLIDGTTGYVLECAEKPDLEGLVAKVRELVGRAGDQQLFSEDGVGRKFLDRNFSVGHMLKEYVTCTVNGLRLADEELGLSERRRVA